MYKIQKEKVKTTTKKYKKKDGSTGKTISKRIDLTSKSQFEANDIVVILLEKDYKQLKKQQEENNTKDNATNKEQEEKIIKLQKENKQLQEKISNLKDDTIKLLKKIDEIQSELNNSKNIIIQYEKETNETINYYRTVLQEYRSRNLIQRILNNDVSEELEKPETKLIK